MKKSFFGLMAVLGFVTGTQAALASQFAMPGLVAREGYSLYRSNLTDIRLDPALQGNLAIRGGTVEIDTVARQAMLRIWRAPHCPQGAMCAQYLPSPILAKLPIVKKTTNECGVRFMVARLVMPTPEGGAKTLVIVDNTKNTCPTFNILPATEVRYDSVERTVDGSMLHTHSMMYGEPLRKLDAQY